MTNINIKIPDEIHKKLKLEAIKRDETLKNIVILKLKKYSEVKIK